MRVLLVSHRYPPDGIAGVERYTQMLAAELVKAGDTVSIVARRPEPTSQPLHTLRERLPDGVVVHRFCGGDTLSGGSLDHQERLEQLFEAVMVEAAPELVHINHLKDLSPHFIHNAHRHRAAVVLSLHDFYFACPLVHLQKPSGELCGGADNGRMCALTCFAHEGAAGMLRWGIRATYYWRLLGAADRVICPSRFVASYFDELGADPARTHLIPNGVFVEAAGPAMVA